MQNQWGYKVMQPRELRSAYHKEEDSTDAEEETRKNKEEAINRQFLKREIRLLINIWKMSNLTSKQRNANKNQHTRMWNGASTFALELALSP